MLEVISLSFERNDECILHELNLFLKPGDIVHLYGKNGSGKTTFLKLLAGILYPSTGSIYFNAKLIYKNLATYQQNICYIGHKNGINHLLTVYENCRFNLHQYNQPMLDIYLEQFDLLKYATTQCFKLSAGQLKRINLIKLAMSQSKLWLLDEPLASLDLETTNTVMQLITNHVQHTHGAVIISSHQPLPCINIAIQEYKL